MALNIEQAKRIIESALFFSSKPIAIKDLEVIFDEEDEISAEAIKKLVGLIREDYRGRGLELVEVSSGYRFQVCADLAPWVSRMMTEKPARYSRALLETLALVAYKQPITRAEVEEVRGVAVSTNIIRTLEEREWIKVIGHRDVPGKPALFATTKTFLDDMNLKSLTELPTLAEIQDLDDQQLSQQLSLALNETEKAAEVEGAEDASQETTAEDLDIELDEIVDVTVDVESDEPEAESKLEQELELVVEPETDQELESDTAEKVHLEVVE